MSAYREVQPSSTTQGARRIAVPESAGVVTAGLFEDLFKTFEEENSRLRTLLREQKKHTDQVLEGNKMILKEIQHLRTKLVQAQRPGIFDVAYFTVVRGWDEFNRNCDNLGVWCDRMCQDHPVGWIIATGILSLVAFGLMLEKIANNY